MKSHKLYFAWVLALIGSLGSFYISEILEITPCDMCWYQRICLFPLAIILGIAAYRSFNKIVPYVITLPILGMALSLLQVLMQEVPAFAPLPLCGPGHNCQEVMLELFGFLTIPMLSFINFTLITCLLNSCRKDRQNNA